MVLSLGWAPAYAMSCGSCVCHCMLAQKLRPLPSVHTGGAAAAPSASFMPRAVATKAKQPGQAEGGPAAVPKSNDDFRKMLLSGKKE